jgi:class 3 adenylate cyclase
MALPGGIQVTKTVAEAAGNRFVLDQHGTSEVKGLGPIATCLLVGRRRHPDV